MKNLWLNLFIVSIILLVVVSLVAVNLSQTLNTTKSELADTKDELNTKIEELVFTKTELDSTKAKLAAKESQLTIKETELTLVNNQLISTKNQLQTAIDGKNQLISSYESLRNTINVRFGDTQEDRRSFITPSDIIISSKVQEITGGFTEEVKEQYDDVERLYQWVVNNVDYSSDSYLPNLPSSLSGTFDWISEFWRMPAETLADKTGDCEDMALLLDSMVENYYQGRFAVWVIVIRSASNDSGHMAVAIPVQGKQIVILDPAGKYYTGILWYSVLYSEMASVEINNWLTHWSSQMPGAYVNTVFSETVDQQFSSTAEFLTWFNQR